MSKPFLRYVKFILKFILSKLSHDDKFSLVRFLLPEISAADRLWLARSLLPELDYAENWNNTDPNTNGEYWLLQKVAPRCSIVCDVGAHVGNWTNACLMANPNVHIYAFEASPPTQEQFSRRFASAPNVHLLRVGLGDESAMLKFYDHGTGSGLSGFFSRELSVGKEPQQVIQVACAPLDDLPEFANKTIDFLKIDTEGSEMRVLRGSKTLLAQKRIRLIQFEYGGTWIDAKEFLADAFHFFKQLGYSFGRLFPKDIQWISNFDHRKLENYKYSNYVACASYEDMVALGLEND